MNKWGWLCPNLADPSFVSFSFQDLLAWLLSLMTSYMLQVSMPIYKAPHVFARDPNPHESICWTSQSNELLFNMCEVICTLILKHSQMFPLPTTNSINPEVCRLQAFESIRRPTPIDGGQKSSNASVNSVDSCPFHHMALL